MSTQRDFSGEPRAYFLMRLIQYNSDLATSMCNKNGQLSTVEALVALRGLILQLDKKTKKDLNPIMEKINLWRQNTKLIKNRQQIEDLYSEVADYLHEGWFKELKFARPRIAKKGHLSVPKKE
jgi:hypothetical protein